MKRPIDFFLPITKGRGQNDGDKPGAGEGGTCVCPECGYEMAHKTGEPCNKTACPKCGAKMTRGKTADKPEGNTFVDRHPDPDWMHSLPGYQDEVAIHDALAEKYARENNDKDEREV